MNSYEKERKWLDLNTKHTEMMIMITEILDRKRKNLFKNKKEGKSESAGCVKLGPVLPFFISHHRFFPFSLIQ
jgi:hypothetical protein